MLLMVYQCHVITYNSLLTREKGVWWYVSYMAYNISSCYFLFILSSTDTIAPTLFPYTSIPDVQFAPATVDATLVLLDNVPISPLGCSAEQQTHGQQYSLLSQWLTAWQNHTKHCSLEPLVPAAATQVTTPLNPFTWRCLLSRYPDQR